jgi:hypothetical protein
MPSYLTGDVKDIISRMICMDPEKRITIPEIKRHPWWRRLDKHVMALEIQGISIPTFQELKEKKGIEKKGDKQEDEDEVVAQVLQEEEEIINKTADVDAESIKSPQEPAPVSEEIDPDIIQAMDQLGWISDIDRIKEGLTNAAKNFETVMYNLLKKRKEETGEVVVPESYHQKMSVSMANPIDREDDSIDKAAALRRRLTEAMLEEGGQPGSPPSGKGMQWFAFWKKKLPLGSPKEKVPSVVNSHFGLHSSKTEQEIMAELDRAAKVLQIQLSMVNDVSIRAKCDTGVDKSVELDITMSRIPDGDGYFLNFNKVSGEIYAARVLFDVLQQELKI